MLELASVCVSVCGCRRRTWAYMLYTCVWRQHKTLSMKFCTYLRGSSGEREREEREEKKREGDERGM